MDEHQKLQRNIRRKYLIALSLVFFLITLATYIIQVVIQDQEHDAKIINIAGQQRMLSQKIALYNYRLQNNPQGRERNVLLLNLNEAVHLFSENFHYLMGKDNSGNDLLSHNVRALFLKETPSLKDRVERYIKTAEAVTKQQPLSYDQTKLFEHAFTEALLADLNNIVLEIENEAKNRVERLGILELSVWFLALFILAIELIFIFRPMEKQIVVTLQKLEHKRQQALTAERLANSANDAKTRFLATMSHELRTPLNGIFGMVQLAQEEDEQDKRRRYLDKALDSGKHLLSLINDILNLANIEENKLEVDMTDINIAALIKSSLSQFALSCQEKGIEFEHICTNPIPQQVKTDATKIRQIIDNVVGNAVKFTHSGKVTVTTLFSVNKGHFELTIGVADTGIGIDQANQSSIFKRFNQADSNINRRYNGSGLGLAITEELITLMKGSISLSSEINKGSIFTVTIPLYKAESENALNTINQAQKSNTPPQKKAWNKLNILLAEDNDINAEIIEHILTNEGHHVHHVTDGSIAVEQLQKSAFDLILMDINMPNMDGLQATRKIRETLKLNTPIIAITANAYELDIQASKDAGMTDYLTKPVDRKNLIQTVNTIAEKTHHRNAASL